MKKAVLAFLGLVVILTICNQACNGDKSDANGNYKTIKVDNGAVSIGDPVEADVFSWLSTYQDLSKTTEEWQLPDGSYGHKVYYTLNGKSCCVKFEEKKVTSIHCDKKEK